VHLPFCAHRCGYCDFVTVVGRRAQHGTYVDALLAELALEGGVDQPVLLDPAEAGEGLGDHARVEVHVVGRLHIGGRSRDRGLDAGFDVLGGGHPQVSMVAVAILCEV
jgi:hypothetical protein